MTPKSSWMFCERTRNPAEALKIEALILVFRIVLVKADVARKAGELERDCGLSLSDALIDATALLETLFWSLTMLGILNAS